MRLYSTASGIVTGALLAARYVASCLLTDRKRPITTEHGLDHCQIPFRASSAFLLVPRFLDFSSTVWMALRR